MGCLRSRAGGVGLITGQVAPSNPASAVRGHKHVDSGRCMTDELKERALVSQRTKAGLAAAKARGTKLGNPDMGRLRGLGVKAVKAEADRHAATVRPIIEKIQARGAASLRAIAAELTRMRVPTARGGAEWSAQQVSNILKRTP